MLFTIGITTCFLYSLGLTSLRCRARGGARQPAALLTRVSAPLWAATVRVCTEQGTVLSTCAVWGPAGASLLAGRPHGEKDARTPVTGGGSSGGQAQTHHQGEQLLLFLLEVLKRQRAQPPKHLLPGGNAWQGV